MNPTTCFSSQRLRTQMPLSIHHPHRHIHWVLSGGWCCCGPSLHNIIFLSLRSFISFFFLFILTDRRSTCEAEPTADAAAAAGDDCLASSPTLCPSSTNGSDGKYWHVLSLVYCLEFIWLRRSWNKMGKFFFGIFEPTPKGDPFTAWRNRILMS